MQCGAANIPRPHTSPALDSAGSAAAEASDRPVDALDSPQARVVCL